MASNAPKSATYWVEIALAAAAGTLLLAAMAPAPADAGLFGGKKKPTLLLPSAARTMLCCISVSKP